MKENKIKQVLFIIRETGFPQFLVADLYSDKRVTVIEGYLRDIHSSILRLLRRIHFSYTVNSRIDLPFKGVWKCSLRDVDWDHGTEYYVVFMGTALRSTDYKYLSKLRNEYDIKYILLLLDPWDNDVASLTARLFEDKLRFDHIYSFDPMDVKTHDFIYTNVPYSPLCDEAQSDIEYDIYLAANVKTKNGAKVFHEVYSRLMDDGVSAHFRLVNVPEEDQIYKNEIVYNHHIEYPEIVKGVKNSNCILEVLPLDQKGATLRYYEAVCYNKKLLTNNTNVVDFPFYDPRYIHLFEKPEDIDCDWIKERIPVDYHYDGRYSPMRLIDKVLEL